MFMQGMLSLNGFGLRVPPTGRGEVKPGDCPTVDDRASAPYETTNAIYRW